MMFRANKYPHPLWMGMKRKETKQQVKTIQSPGNEIDCCSESAKGYSPEAVARAMFSVRLLSSIDSRTLTPPTVFVTTAVWPFFSSVAFAGTVTEFFPFCPI